MPWNEPGSGPERDRPSDRSGDRSNDRPSDRNTNDPWGQRRGGGGNQQPPDLDEVVRNLQDKIGGLLGGRGRGSGGGGGGSDDGGGGSRLPGRSFGGLGIGMALLIGFVLWMLTGFYQVEQSEKGIELMFGEYNDIKDAGLRWHLPTPIETVEIINTERINTVEVGYRGGQSSRQKKRSIEDESLMLTQDENIIDIQFAVQYNVKDPRNLIFNVAEAPRNTDLVVRQATESAVREIVGSSTMDFVLTSGRAEVASKTKSLVQVILDRYEAGINVLAVEMQDAQPPAQVKDAFDDAVRAREDEERAKNEAEAYANDIIPRARGQAARVTQEAEAYRATVVAKATGEASRFAQVLTEYKKAPEVTRDRLYLESMEQVLKNSSKLMIDQKGGNNMMYLPLDRMMQNRPQSDAGGMGSSSPTIAAGAAAMQNNSSGRSGRSDGRTSRN